MNKTEPITCDGMAGLEDAQAWALLSMRERMHWAVKHGAHEATGCAADIHYELPSVLSSREKAAAERAGERAVAKEIQDCAARAELEWGPRSMVNGMEL